MTWFWFALACSYAAAAPRAASRLDPVHQVLQKAAKNVNVRTGQPVEMLHPALAEMQRFSIFLMGSFSSWIARSHPVGNSQQGRCQVRKIFLMVFFFYPKNSKQILELLKNWIFFLFISYLFLFYVCRAALEVSCLWPTKPEGKPVSASCRGD